MARRMIAGLMGLLAALALLAPMSMAQEDASVRVVAVGDLHGDFDQWLAIAQAAGLVDDSGQWSGGTTTLVQMGDVTDRGPDSLKIIRQLQQLDVEANAAGGDVIVLLGNHEAMNVLGDLRYVHPGEFDAFRDHNSKRRRDATWRANRQLIEATFASMDPPLEPKEAKEAWYAQTPLGKLEHRRAWMPGGELGQWAATLPAVVKVGETLFVHGGLSVERGLMPIETINAQISAAFDSGDAIDRSAPEDPLGPLWYRGNVARGEDETVRPTISDELDRVLAFHDAARLIVAHTPSIEGIVASEETRLIRVDTGISRYYGGPPSFLEIKSGEVTAYQRTRAGDWESRNIAADEEVPTP